MRGVRGGRGSQSRNCERYERYIEGAVRDTRDVHNTGVVRGPHSKSMICKRDPPSRDCERFERCHPPTTARLTLWLR